MNALDEHRAGPPDPGETRWARDLRAKARAMAAALGLPSGHDEAWKHARLPREGLALQPAAEAPEGSAAAAARDHGDALVLVTANGRLVPGQCRLQGAPARVSLGALRDEYWNDRSVVQRWLGTVASWHEHALVAINTASMPDGVLVYLPPRVTLERPVHIVHATVPGQQDVASYPRTLILLGEGASATIVEAYTGEGGAATTAIGVTEIVARAGATLSHHTLVDPGRLGHHLGSTSAVLSRDSRVALHLAVFGGATVRQEVGVALAESGAECELAGWYGASGDDHVELRTLVTHQAPGCTSKERTRGLLGGQARGSFFGRIVVPADAQKTDASQENANLLLSEGAVVHARPQLEIFADEVRCSHGAWVGQLEQEAIYYLRSRGLGLAEARGLLTRAFADVVLAGAPDAWFREQAGRKLTALLGSGGGTS